MLCVCPNLPFLPPFPFGNHRFVFKICKSVSVLQVNSFVSVCKIPHISDIWYLSFSV